MSWFFPFSDSWKKRACRYLLQRYLGQFLEEKLTLDQLSVDLYNGTGSVSDVCLDVQGLNELAEQQSLPLEFVDGYIGEMSVSIPWATILRDSSYVQISGMVLTVQPKQRAEEMGAGSLFESMISMTSSIQLATEIQQTEPPPDPAEVDNQNQTIEGIELIARTLDSILCKIKVKFVDTTIRLEHVPKGSKTGVALEIHVKNMDYCDEAGCDISSGHVGESTPGSPNGESAFAIKKFHLDGVSLSTDEFPTSARTVSRSLMLSTSLEGQDESGSSSPSKDYPEDRRTYEPVLFGKLVGRQELRVKVKQSEGIPGPKVDVEVNMGSLMIFATPRQIHLLQALLHGLATPGIQDSSNVITKEKRMEKADFERVGLDLLNQLHPGAAAQKESKGLQNMQGWSAADPDEDSDDEFHPIGGALSRGDSLASSMDSSTMSSVSGLSKSTSVDFSTRSSYLRHGKRKKHRGSSSDPEPGSDRNHYQLRLSSLSIVLLHEDILATSGESESLLASSVHQLNAVAVEFFQKLALFAVSPHGNKDFLEARQVFLNACRLNHMRLLAAPVMLELEERDSTLLGTITGGSVELLECLVEEAQGSSADARNNSMEQNSHTDHSNNTDQSSNEQSSNTDQSSNEQSSSVDVKSSTNDKTSGSSDRKAVYVELLKFMREDGEQTDPIPKHPITQQPDVKIRLKHCKKSSRSSTANSVELAVQLEQCWSEVDISIMDRISALLNPKPLCSISSQYKADNTMQSAFDQAIETCSECDSKLEWKVTSSYVVIKLRFPIPDLRPVHDMARPPWWCYRLHPDIAWLNLTDIALRSHLTSRQPALSFEISCQSALASFQEGGTGVSVPFGYTTFDDSGDYIQDVGWPRLVIRVYSSLNYDLEDPLEEPQCMTHSIIEPPLREASPFTYRKIFHDGGDAPHAKSTDRTLYEGEELVIPGDKAEINNFIDDACRKALIQVDIQLPTAYLQFPNKHIYELIYNRFTSDLLLWTPSAPSSQTWTQNINVNYNNVFSMCKGTQDSDSDPDSDGEEGGGGIFYSIHEHRTRNPRLLPQDQLLGQSKVTLSLSVSQCVLDMYPDAKDNNGVLEESAFGQVLLSCEDVRVFTVSKYKGKTGNSFVIAQVNNAALYHSDKVHTRQSLSSDSCKFPPTCDHLVETIYKSDETSIPTSSGSNYQPVGCGADTSDMLTVAVHTYLDDRQLKMNRVSCCLRGATLRHRMSLPYQSVYSQLIDFFDVIDYPVTGYEPLPIVVEYHQHFFDCALDYRPLYLPYSALISLGSFSICCNLAARTTSSTLRFIAEDISLFISNRKIHRTVDLKQDYVCVIEIGLFELSVRVSDAPNTPHLELRAWNNMVHIRTCADSARALLQLLAYFGSDGDLKRDRPRGGEEEEEGEGEVEMRMGGEGEEGRINDLMEEAMSETVPARGRHKNNSGSEQQVEVFLFPDEGNGNELDEEDITVEDDEYLDKEFCFLEHEAGSGFIYQTREPEVHVLITSPIKLIDNHFSTPLGKTDLLQPPKHFPTPLQRYTLRETTIIWSLYGGSDFAEEPASCPSSPGCRLMRSSLDSTATVAFANHRLSGVKEISFSPRRESLDSIGSSPSKQHSMGHTTSCNIPLRWQDKGGVCRQHDVKMQLQLNKLRFQHDVYPDGPDIAQSSRQVILIHDVEIRDRLASSNINKFLYAYSSKARPRQSHAHMVVLKALHLRSEHSREELESCLKVSLLPLRLNIDQDAILFLFTFASELSGIAEDKENLSDTASVSSTESSPASSSGSKKSPIFIKSFVFSPEVLIRLDYQGKHVDMSHGPLAGILMGLAQLNCSEIRLKKINHRHGLLGFNKLLSFMQAEWSQDIYKNQLPSLLGGVGPMYSLVQLAQGIRDLFWLPIEQYQKDGRIVRGLQRGANSFTTSTAMAALELTARIVMAIQTVAETAFDMVSPGPSVKRHRQNSNKKKQRHSQPVDIREGVTNALTLMREGIGETAQTLLRVASEEHEAKGAVGAVGGVLRQIPPTALQPIILASKATSNVLGGVKSQLVPDARKEAAHKWRTDEL